MERPYEEEMEVEQVPPVASASVLTSKELGVIFKFLGFKDLGSAAMVCKIWKEVAYNEMTTRRSPQFVCELFDVDDTSYTAKRLSEDLRIKPRLGVVFMKMLKQFEPWTPTECFFHHMPQSCEPLAIMSGCQIVADQENLEEVKDELAVAAFLPEIPNLQIYRHNILEQDVSPKNAGRIILGVDQFFKKYVWSPTQESKCVLMFGNYNTSAGMLSRIADYIQENYKPETVALCGAAAGTLETCSFKHSREEAGACLADAACVIVCLSSPSLRSWSIVLPRYSERDDEFQEHDIVRRLKIYQGKIQLKNHSLALMCSTTFGWSNVHKAKIDGFKQVFPKVPLVGIHGFAEYGLNSLNKGREKTVGYQYSTVYLILTYD